MSGIDDAVRGGAERRPRHLVVCCDGTNNTLTGGSHDTNVVLLHRYLVANPASDAVERITYYDPGVGSPATVPSTDPIDAVQRALARAWGLAAGRGVYDNVGEAYLFLMRHWRDADDRIFCFGFSRGAFTARCVAGMVNLFGIVAPEHEALVPMLVEVYFASSDDTPVLAGRLTRTVARSLSRPAKSRESVAAEVREQFTTKTGAGAGVHFIGVWDTVESVGLPGPLARKNPSTGSLRGKRIRHARQALSLDEHRWTFEPKLYLDTSEPDGQTLKQRCYPGVHCNVGGGYDTTVAGISDLSLIWMIDEAAAAGLVAATTDGHPIPGHPWSRNVERNDELYATPWWALAGMVLREIPPKAAAHVELDHAVLDDARTVWSDPRPGGPLVVAIALAALAYIACAACLVIGDHRVDDVLVAPLRFAGALAASLWGDGLFAAATALWGGPWREPGWAAFWTVICVASAGYVLARIASRAFAWLAGGRLPRAAKPPWSAYGMAPLAAVGSSVVAASWLWVALAWQAAGVHFLAAFSLWWASVAAWVGAFGCVACLPLVVARLLVVRDDDYATPLEKRPAAVRRTMRIACAVPLVVVAPVLAVWWVVVNPIACRIAEAIGAFRASSNDRPRTAANASFRTNELCWASGFHVVRGRRYQATLTTPGDWFDQTARTDVAGLPTRGPKHWITWPAKRLWFENWFVPVLRVGTSGFGCHVLRPDPPARPARYAAYDGPEIGRLDPLPREVAERIVEAAPHPEAPRVASVVFTAKRDGEVFLYVNDAVLMLPGRTHTFYGNNRGSGTLVVTPL